MPVTPPRQSESLTSGAWTITSTRVRSRPGRSRLSAPGVLLAVAGVMLTNSACAAAGDASPAELSRRNRGRALSRSVEQQGEPAGGAPSRTHNQVSDAAASLLNVWSCASSLGLRERRGRTLLQKGESKDNLPTTFVMNVCLVTAGFGRFQPISSDLESYRKRPDFALSRR
jgi:hypothetical protein